VLEAKTCDASCRIGPLEPRERAIGRAKFERGSDTIVKIEMAVRYPRGIRKTGCAADPSNEYTQEANYKRSNRRLFCQRERSQMSGRKYKEPKEATDSHRI